MQWEHVQETGNKDCFLRGLDRGKIYFTGYPPPISLIKALYVYILFHRTFLFECVPSRQILPFLLEEERERGKCPPNYWIKRENKN